MKANVGELAEADRAIRADRIPNPEAAPKPLRIVVWQLVDHRERPHLKREHRRIAGLGPGNEHRERQRSRRGGRERNEDACGHWGRSKPGQDGPVCCVLADGAGGHGGGDVASQTAVAAVLEAYGVPVAPLGPADAARPREGFELLAGVVVDPVAGHDTTGQAGLADGTPDLTKRGSGSSAV